MSWCRRSWSGDRWLCRQSLSRARRPWSSQFTFPFSRYHFLAAIDVAGRQGGIVAGEGIEQSKPLHGSEDAEGGGEQIGGDASPQPNGTVVVANSGQWTSYPVGVRWAQYAEVRKSDNVKVWEMLVKDPAEGESHTGFNLSRLATLYPSP